MLAAIAALSLVGCTGSGNEDKAGAPVVELSAALDTATSWTDGNNFLNLHRSGDTLLLTGGTLHEGGSVVRLLVTGDSTMRVLGLEEYDMPDYSAFGKVGNTVRHRSIGDIDMLVALDSVGNPVDVLQRYDGKPIDFVFGFMREMLAGKYADGNDTYTFTADGRSQRPEQEAEQPYGFDLIYDMPSGSLSLVGGEHIAVQIVPEGLDIFNSAWERNEEAWLAGDRLCQAVAVPDEPRGVVLASANRVMLTGLIEFISEPAAQWLLQTLKAVDKPTALQSLNLQLLDSRLSRPAEGNNDGDESVFPHDFQPSPTLLQE